MTETALSQSEADALIAMEKGRVDAIVHLFPATGSVVIPLQSLDKREQFVLDLSRGRIDLQKVKYQERGRQVVVLVRLDIGGPSHRNPDDEEVPCPHMHLYREGYGDKWAFSVPAPEFPRLADLFGTLEDFLRYCHISDPPVIDRGLFT